MNGTIMTAIASGFGPEPVPFDSHRADSQPNTTLEEEAVRYFSDSEVIEWSVRGDESSSSDADSANASEAPRAPGHEAQLRHARADEAPEGDGDPFSGPRAENRHDSDKSKQEKEEEDEDEDEEDASDEEEFGDNEDEEDEESNNDDGDGGDETNISELLQAGNDESFESDEGLQRSRISERDTTPHSPQLHKDGGVSQESSTAPTRPALTRGLSRDDINIINGTLATPTAHRERRKRKQRQQQRRQRAQEFLEEQMKRSKSIDPRVRRQSFSHLPQVVQATKPRYRRSSHDYTSAPRAFIIDVETTLQRLLSAEDTSGHYQITVLDDGPKTISLKSVYSGGSKSYDLRGTYFLSNLLQELAIALSRGFKTIVLTEPELTENPVDRLSRLIRAYHWSYLKRKIDAKGLKAILLDPKTMSKETLEALAVVEKKSRDNSKAKATFLPPRAMAAAAVAAVAASVAAAAESVSSTETVATSPELQSTATDVTLEERSEIDSKTNHNNNNISSGDGGMNSLSSAPVASLPILASKSTRQRTRSSGMSLETPARSPSLSNAATAAAPRSEVGSNQGGSTSEFFSPSARLSSTFEAPKNDFNQHQLLSHTQGPVYAIDAEGIVKLEGDQQAFLADSAANSNITSDKSLLPSTSEQKCQKETQALPRDASSLRPAVSTSRTSSGSKAAKGSSATTKSAAGAASKCKLPRNRIYVPATDPDALRYYKHVAQKYPDLCLDVIDLPKYITPEYVMSINKAPGILSLALVPDGQVDKDENLVGVPFVVPGGRFNEMYGWDSHFIALGLIADDMADLAKSMVDNLVYQIHHYGKILNANRTYYLTRSQPPFLSSMALFTFRALCDISMHHPIDRPAEQQSAVASSLPFSAAAVATQIISAAGSAPGGEPGATPSSSSSSSTSSGAVPDANKPSWFPSETQLQLPWTAQSVDLRTVGVGCEVAAQIRREWLRQVFLAAVKEYRTVWMSSPKYVASTGLSRYCGTGIRIPPETEPGHFDTVLRPYAEQHKMSIADFTVKYASGEISVPSLDEYFLHDRSVRESGHDTTYRLDGRSAFINPVDLNSLLFKYEIDIGNVIRDLFEGELVWVYNTEAAKQFRPTDAMRKGTGKMSGGDQQQQQQQPQQQLPQQHHDIGILPAWEEQVKLAHPEDFAAGREVVIRETPELFFQAAERRRVIMNQLMWDQKNGIFYDYDFVQRSRTMYESATAFYPLWAGIASENQAKTLVSNALPKFEMAGGIVASTEESRGPIGKDRPSRQWDYPFGWAPHQMIVWDGLAKYGFMEDAQRLVYRWLNMATKAAAEFNGVIPEKFDVVRETHRVSVEYGNVGVGFRCVSEGGFGWMNASYQVGLSFLSDSLRKALGAHVPVEKAFRTNRPTHQVSGLSSKSTDSIFASRKDHRNSPVYYKDL